LWHLRVIKGKGHRRQSPFTILISSVCGATRAPFLFLQMMPPRHNNLLLLTAAALMLLTVVIGYPHGLDSSIRLCGSNLSDILQLVCQSRGGLNGPSATSPDTYGANFRGGIARECCERPCSWRVILSYCANSSAEELNAGHLVEMTTAATADSQRDGTGFDDRLIELLFGPMQVPKRRTKKSGSCPKCNCSRRTRKVRPTN
jgi:hypothetical protein